MSSDFPWLADDELLHRQVVPKWRYPDGTPMSSNFMPTSKDGGLLSTRMGSRMSAEGAYRSHVGNGWQSAGTWSFTAGETGLHVMDDSGCEDNPEHHASVDFRDCTRRRAERASKIIKQAAVTRGATYIPSTADEDDADACPA